MISAVNRRRAPGPLERHIKSELDRAIRKHRGRTAQVAAELGVSERTVERWVKSFELVELVRRVRRDRDAAA